MGYTNLLGQVRVGIRGAQVVSQSLLLDSYTDVIGAYSLRKLKASWTGNAILVRRSLDNTESVIGFDTNGDLDQSTLLSFVRPTITGYVLDQYTGSSVGLSLRKISGSYSGSAIRVRRSGDNSEIDIAFDTDGNLDSTSLLSFVGANNQVGYSEEFDNSYWHKNDSSIAANSTIAPDGTMTADLLKEGTSNWNHSLGKQTSTSYPSGTSYNFSVYLKKGTGTLAPDTIALGFNESNSTTLPYVIFNISTGVVVTSGNGGDSNFGSSIQDVGNGWFRCSMFGTVVTTANRFQLPYVRFVNNQNTLPGQYLGNVNRDIFVWGYQFVRELNDTSALTLKEYRKTSISAGGSAFVKTWYDQSGNGRNATQTTSANQPQIVSNSAILLQVGKPSIKYDGVNDYMTISTFTASVKTIFSLFQHNGVDSYDGILTARTSGQVNLGLPSDERGGFTMANSQTIIDSIDATSFYVNSFQTKNLESTNGLNYTICIKSNSLGGVKNFIIGSDILGGGRWLNGSVNEIIMYSNDLTSDRGNFIGNINTYYNWMIFMNNGYVKTWYDQSGLGRHASQTTASSQPKIFSNNSVIKQGIKPTILYDGVDDYLVIPTFNDKVQSIFSLFNKNTTNFSNYNGIITGRDTLSSLSSNSNERVGFTGVAGGNSITGFENTTSVWINSESRNVTNYATYNVGQALPYRLDLNLVSQFATASLVGSKNIIFGADTLGGRFLSGSIPEMMIYSSNQVSNRSVIESNINSYYSVWDNIVTTGLSLNLDVNKLSSYPGTGTSWNDMAGSNNGTMMNSVGYTASNGGGLTFNGTNQYVDFGQNKFKVDNFTMEIVFKINQAPTIPGGCNSPQYGIIGQQDWGYTLRMFTDGKATFQVFDVSGGSVGVKTQNSIVGNIAHITVKKNGLAVSIYLNGVLQNTSNLTNSVVRWFHTTWPFQIGNGQCGMGNYYMNGSVYLARFYTTVLTDSEILQNFNATKTRFGL
jgi:hypothetical protein